MYGRIFSRVKNSATVIMPSRSSEMVPHHCRTAYAWHHQETAVLVFEQEEQKTLLPLSDERFDVPVFA